MIKLTIYSEFLENFCTEEVEIFFNEIRQITKLTILHDSEHEPDMTVCT